MTRDVGKADCRDENAEFRTAHSASRVGNDSSVASPAWFKWGMQIISLIVVGLYGPQLLQFWHYDPAHSPHDFAQDWCSARNWHTGEAIYASLEETLPRYLYRLKPTEKAHIKHNAHPPASVLVILPLGALSYGNALAVWETIILAALVGGLILLTRQMGIAITPWALLPAAALLLISPPVFLDFAQGNWSIVLFFCITLTWALARQDRDLRAGLMLGLTASLKLYPGFLALFFLAQRRWLGLLGFVIGFVSVQLVTGLVLGWQCLVDYQHTTKEVWADFGAAWNNSSLPGLAAKLFAPQGISAEKLVPLMDAPWLVNWISGAAFLGLIFFTGRLAYRARQRTATSGVVSDDANQSAQLAAQDDIFAIMITASILLSPLSWMGSALFLGMPIFVLWQRSARWPRLRFLLAILFWFAFSAQIWIANEIAQLPVSERIFQPWETLTYLNTLCYAFLAFLLLQWYLRKHGQMTTGRQ